MRYGLISDIHFGYHAGNRVTEDGINIRELDHYDAAYAAVRELKKEGVDVILDCGDMAEIPAPRKRAILNLIDLVRYAGVPYYSVDGNHTSLKSSSDIHIYDIIASECSNFHGYRGPAYDKTTRVSFVPHSYNNDEIREFIETSLHRDTEILIGHWAADNIPYVGQVAMRDLPEGVRIFLGHYHNYRPSSEHHPTYVGSTEKTAWDQWDYPTGCGIWDSDTESYTRIDIPTRDWANIEGDASDCLEMLTSTDVRDKIARLTVYATPAEYSLVDQVAAKAYARDSRALHFTMRRKNPLNIEEAVQQRLGEQEGLVAQWAAYITDVDLPKNVSRKRIADMGSEALA